jgi:hypothetical protein
VFACVLEEALIKGNPPSLRVIPDFDNLRCLPNLPTSSEVHGSRSMGVREQPETNKQHSKCSEEDEFPRPPRLLVLVDRLATVTTLAAVSTGVVSTGPAVVAVKVVVVNVVVVVVVEAVTTEVHATVGTATVVAGVVVAHAVGTHTVVTVVVGGFVHRRVGDDDRVAGVAQAPATAMNVSESVTTVVSAMRVGSGPTTTASTAPSSTFSTLCESLRINCQGQGDCEHSDERDFA